MPRPNQKTVCPECGNPKQRASTRCQACHLKAGGPGAFQPANTQILRSINVQEEQDPSRRPPHYPPACPACNGFGFLAGSWRRCHACTEHPGHQMSHQEWTAAILAAGLTPNTVGRKKAR